jgi:parvulin-like peptidyl-prolyl isomerase
MKNEVKKTETKCCCKNPKNCKNMHMFFLVLILGVSLGVFYKYGIVATVNGKAISRIAYIKKLEKNDAKQLLDQMITENLILGEANKKGVKIEKNVIDEEIKKIDEQIKAQGQTLEAALSSRGMTKADLEDQINMQKVVEKLSAPTTEITQAQIDEFLKANKAQLPAKSTKEELQTIAKDELARQASDSAVTAWLEGLRKDAKIIYR